MDIWEMGGGINYSGYHGQGGLVSGFSWGWIPGIQSCDQGLIRLQLSDLLFSRLNPTTWQLR